MVTIDLESRRHGGRPSIVVLGWATYSLVIGVGGRDGALRTSVTRVGRACNLDVIGAGGAARLGEGSSEGWEHESGELGVHLEKIGWFE